MLGILPGVRGALALTESLITGGCAAHRIFLLMAHESKASPDLQDCALLVFLGIHRGTSVYCVGDQNSASGTVSSPIAQFQRFAQLIDHFAHVYPKDWKFHQDLVRGGSPVGVVHLDEPIDEEATIARTVLAHSVTRLQISDLPNVPMA